MIRTVIFPKLGLEFEIDRVAFAIGSFEIYWYGIILAMGFFFGAIYAFTYCRKVGVDEDRLIDVILFGLLGGIVGARLYFVAFSWDLYANDLSKILDIRTGGIAIYGGLIGGILAGIITAKVRNVRIRPALDLAAGAFLISQSIGRWGNFVNVEAFGSNTDSVLGMTGPQIVGYLQQVKQSGAQWAANIDPTMPVHPTFLYESLWCLLGFVIMVFVVMKHRHFDGEAFLFYAGWYGAGRAVIEGLRTDSLMVGNIRVSQVFAALCVVASISIWLYVMRRKKVEGDSFLPLYITSEDGQRTVNGIFYQKAAAPEIILEPEEDESENSESEAPQGDDGDDKGRE